jgi:hypothetical protein
VSGQLHSPDALPPGKEPQYLLDRRLVGRGGRKKKIHHCRCRESNSGRPSPSLVTILMSVLLCSVIQSRSSHDVYKQTNMAGRSEIANSRIVKVSTVTAGPARALLSFSQYLFEWLFLES